MAMHSNSMVAYHCWVGVSEHDPHCMRKCRLSFLCISANPRPCSLEASVRRNVSASSSDGWMTVLEVNSFFTSRKLFSSHSHIMSFLSSGHSVLVICAKSGTNKANCWASPMNDLRALGGLGRGKRLIAAYFYSSGCMPSAEMICPAKFILLPSSSFFLEIVMLCCLHLPRMMRVLSIRWFISSAQISVSSTIFLPHGMPLMRTSDWQHHLSEEAFNPMGAQRYLNFPWGSRKVVLLELSSSNPSWKYPCTASSCCMLFPFFSLCIWQPGGDAAFAGWNYIAFNIYRADGTLCK